jgi:hypothetical protein
MTSRRSYRGLMALPGWGLYDEHDRLVATCSATSAPDARDVFRRPCSCIRCRDGEPVHVLKGARVRRLP